MFISLLVIALQVQLPAVDSSATVRPSLKPPGACFCAIHRPVRISAAFFFSLPFIQLAWAITTGCFLSCKALTNFVYSWSSRRLLAENTQLSRGHDTILLGSAGVCFSPYAGHLNMGSGLGLLFVRNMSQNMVWSSYSGAREQARKARSNVRIVLGFDRIE